ncbi:MAG: amino acid ABC transporter substrate-binding protein [archaeon]|nr:amino acid ABC transporter substrate-binding protein [archaeon]
MNFRKRNLRNAISTTALVVIIVVIIVVAGAAGYLALTSTSSHTTNPYSNVTYIGIGMSMPLSGTFAEDGTLSLDGLKLWAQNVNASGGIFVSSLNKKLPVKLIYSDDASSATNVVTIYDQLVARSDVQFLIAPYSSPLTLAAAPIAEQHHLLLLSHGGASNSIWSKGYNYTVGVLSPASEYMLPVIDALNNLSSKPTKIAFFFGNDAFSLSVNASVVPYAISKGFTVVYDQSYDESASSYTTQLSAIGSSGAQVLIGGAHFVDGENIMRGIQSLGLHFSAISLLVAPDDPTFYSDLGTLANGVITPSQWEANLNFSSFSPYYGNITGEQFNSTFTSTFGLVPNYEAAEAYATGLVLQKAITDSGSLNSTTVRQELSTENFYTFYGHFQIGPTGIQTGHTMVVAQWQNGVKSIIWPTSVATASIEYPIP